MLLKKLCYDLLLPYPSRSTSLLRLYKSMLRQLTANLMHKSRYDLTGSVHSSMHCFLDFQA